MMDKCIWNHLVIKSKGIKFWKDFQYWKKKALWPILAKKCKVSYLNWKWARSIKNQISYKIVTKIKENYNNDENRRVYLCNTISHGTNLTGLIECNNCGMKSIVSFYQILKDSNGFSKEPRNHSSIKPINIEGFWWHTQS